MSIKSKTAIVVSMNTDDKRKIAVKARRLHLSVPELMRRGALSYRSRSSGPVLRRLADAARLAAERAAARIDIALDFIDASNARIAEMERVARNAKPDRWRDGALEFPDDTEL